MSWTFVCATVYVSACVYVFLCAGCMCICVHNYSSVRAWMGIVWCFVFGTPWLNGVGCGDVCECNARVLVCWQMSECAWDEIYWPECDRRGHLRISETPLTDVEMCMYIVCMLCCFAAVLLLPVTGCLCNDSRGSCALRHAWMCVTWPCVLISLIVFIHARTTHHTAIYTLFIGLACVSYTAPPPNPTRVLVYFGKYYGNIYKYIYTAHKENHQRRQTQRWRHTRIEYAILVFTMSGVLMSACGLGDGVYTLFHFHRFQPYSEYRVRNPISSHCVPGTREFGWLHRRRLQIPTSYVNIYVDLSTQPYAAVRIIHTFGRVGTDDVMACSRRRSTIVAPFAAANWLFLLISYYNVWVRIHE